MRDDPFERAAKREAQLSDMAHSRLRGRPLIGLQLAWAVLLALHWWVAGGDGLVLGIHVGLFVLGVGFTIFAVIAMSVANKPRWGMFAIAAGWLPLLAMHWAVVDERNLLLTVHTGVFALILATAVLAAFAVPTQQAAAGDH